MSPTSPLGQERTDGVHAPRWSASRQLLWNETLQAPTRSLEARAAMLRSQQGFLGGLKHCPYPRLETELARKRVVDVQVPRVSKRFG